MAEMTAVEIAQKLISFKTLPPVGNETECAGWLTGLLEKYGFSCAAYEYEPGRPTLVAELKGSGGKKAICLAGHVDVVPLGDAEWSVNPWAGEIKDGKLYGRGAADMKCGMAAATAAVIACSQLEDRAADIRIIYTSGEELGCKGSIHLASIPETLGKAGALIVPEPTSNKPVCCHRGALWLRVTARGVTAHGSMPHLGDNAVYKIIDMIQKVRELDFRLEPHPMLNLPSINLGMINGGLNVNSVPDKASFTLDIRTIPGQDHAQLLERLKGLCGPDAVFETLVDVAPIETDPHLPWMKSVLRSAEQILGEKLQFEANAFFTDAAALTPAYNCPTVILGPGAEGMCHKTDEYCIVKRIEQAAEIYTRLVTDWCST